MGRHVNIQNPEIPYTPDDTGVIQVTECIAQLAIDEIPSASFIKADAAIPDWSFDRIGYDKSVPKCQVVKLIDRHVEPGSNLQEIDLSVVRTRFDICIGTRT